MVSGPTTVQEENKQSAQGVANSGGRAGGNGGGNGNGKEQVPEHRTLQSWNGIVNR